MSEDLFDEADTQGEGFIYLDSDVSTQPPSDYEESVEPVSLNLGTQTPDLFSSSEEKDTEDPSYLELSTQELLHFPSVSQMFGSFSSTDTTFLELSTQELQDLPSTSQLLENSTSTATTDSHSLDLSTQALEISTPTPGFFGLLRRKRSFSTEVYPKSEESEGTEQEQSQSLLKRNFKRIKNRLLLYMFCWMLCILNNRNNSY